MGSVEGDKGWTGLGGNSFRIWCVRGPGCPDWLPTLGMQRGKERNNKEQRWFTPGFRACGVGDQQQGSEQTQYPCPFFSRKLTPVEQKHEILYWQLLAICVAFREWHCLEGAQHKMQVLTDYKHLEYFHKVKDLSWRLLHWALYLPLRFANHVPAWVQKWKGYLRRQSILSSLSRKTEYVTDPMQVPTECSPISETTKCHQCHTTHRLADPASSHHLSISLWGAGYSSPTALLDSDFLASTDLEFPPDLATHGLAWHTVKILQT